MPIVQINLTEQQYARYAAGEPIAVTLRKRIPGAEPHAPPRRDDAEREWYERVGGLGDDAAPAPPAGVTYIDSQGPVQWRQ